MLFYQIGWPCRFRLKKWLITKHNIAGLHVGEIDDTIVAEAELLLDQTIEPFSVKSCPRFNRLAPGCHGFNLQSDGIFCRGPPASNCPRSDFRIVEHRPAADQVARASRP